MICTFTKQEIALAQIQRALDCYQQQFDYISAITLAGAAEEMCGVRLEGKNKCSSALSNQILVLREIEKKLYSSSSTEEKWNEYLNKPRNEIKHWREASILKLTFDWKKEAHNMLDRAISNYMGLYGDVTNEMGDFLAESIGKED